MAEENLAEKNLEGFWVRVDETSHQDCPPLSLLGGYWDSLRNPELVLLLPGLHAGEREWQQVTHGCLYKVIYYGFTF